MNKNIPDIFRQKSKWTDDIKKDTKFCGIGTVNNQIHLQNGQKHEAPSEDRSFAYEFIENEIYAYGLLDGYSGSISVDLAEQCILTDMYFDQLTTLKTKKNDEIIEILKSEFEKTEQTLAANFQEKIVERGTLTINSSELQKGTNEYDNYLKELKKIDNYLNSGCFAFISLLVENRLFLATVGTSHCFLLKYDNDGAYVATFQINHKISNLEEMKRLNDLKADILVSEGACTKTQIFTRCLGDFNSKHFYTENPIFKNCIKPPITSIPGYYNSPEIIDDSSLCMIIYSDGLAQVMNQINLDDEDRDGQIAQRVMEKIIDNQTLNSAAQSVVDEIKREFDDKNDSEYSEREDMTLILRVFHPNIKSKLQDVERKTNTVEDVEASITFTSTLSEVTCEKEDKPLRSSLKRIETGSIKENRVSTITTTSEPQFDEAGNVISYIDLKREFDNLLKNESNKDILQEFENEFDKLENLIIEDVKTN